MVHIFSPCTSSVHNTYVCCSYGVVTVLVFAPKSQLCEHSFFWVRKTTYMKQMKCKKEDTIKLWAGNRLLSPLFPLPLASCMIACQIFHSYNISLVFYAKIHSCSWAYFTIVLTAAAPVFRHGLILLSDCKLDSIFPTIVSSRTDW